MKTISTLFAAILVWTLTGMALHAQTGETALKPADQLKITITGVPPSDQQSMAVQVYTVSNDGSITVQHIGQVRAAGLTPTQLSRNIESTYKTARIYTRPQLNVSRITDVTTSEVVIVNGNVKLPGTAIFRSGMRITDAISEKGGFDDFGNPRKVRLIRDQKTRELDLRDISNHPENNVLLQPGDRIFVPKAGPFG